jgi:two-component system, NtrC family, response regulator AtoC
VRLVAATHRDLPAEVDRGAFREDLFFRLNAAHVVLPPLRDRPRDIPVLARLFLDEACARLGRSGLHVSDGVLRALATLPFRGNVRELRHAMDYAAVVAEGPALEPTDLPPGLGADRLPPRDSRDGPAFRPIAEEVAELEKRRMLEALLATDGNQTRAADLIAMPRRTFLKKLARYRITPPRVRR